MGRQLMAVRSKEYSTQFVFYTLLIRNRLFQSLAAGNLIPGLSRKDILQAKVATPGISEQKKIAAFLSSVDGRIEGLEKKRDLLKEYKKGLMQKLFSQTLRFMDESGKPFPDWMEKRLEEIGRFIGGGTPSRGNGEYWTGNIPWISSSDLTEESIYEVRTTNFITETAVKESATKIVPANSILIVSRVGVGKVAVNKEPLCTSQDFTSLYLGSGNVTFFAYAIKKEIPRLLSCNQGTSIKGFVKSDLAELDILIPCLEEQKKIAECLSAVDRKIEAVEAQVSRTREFKQGLLQKMFV
jgi:type I restriction enzyme S subunit